MFFDTTANYEMNIFFNKCHLNILQNNDKSYLKCLMILFFFILIPMIMRFSFVCFYWLDILKNIIHF